MDRSRRYRALPETEKGVAWMGEGIPHSQRKGVRVIPHSQGFRYAASLPACGGALQSGIKKAQSSKLVALFCYHFAVSEGFEPPVRSHVHLFSRQAPSTTRTTHRRRTAKVEIISELSKKLSASTRIYVFLHYSPSFGGRLLPVNVKRLPSWGSPLSFQLRSQPKFLP